MGSKSDYLEDEILDHILGGGDYTRPGTVYVRLWTTMPDEAGSGGTEVPTGTWSNYAAEAVTNDATNWPAASSSSKSNGTDIDFGTATTSGDVDVAGMTIEDAATGGNMLFHHTFAAAQTVQNGNPVKFPASSITITED